jgi:hypothetical protein
VQSSNAYDEDWYQWKKCVQKGKLLIFQKKAPSIFSLQRMIYENDLVGEAEYEVVVPEKSDIVNQQLNFLPSVQLRRCIKFTLQNWEVQVMI